MSHLLVRALIVLVTLVLVALGGAGSLFDETILAAITGLFLLFAPPRGPLPRTPFILAGLLLLISLMAFIPAGSSASALDATPWRKYLIHECHIAPATSLGQAPSGPDSIASFPIDNTWTPQPWLTAQQCGVLFLGLAWGLYLLTLPWEREDRIFATELLIFGIALLSLLSALAFLLHFHVPFWTQEENRGWFPNRNQTADVLAVVGIVTYALIFDRLRKGRSIGYGLLLALVPIVIELIISYSRAGILLFFGGLLVWHIWPRQLAGRQRGLSPKWIALSASLGVLILAVFLIWGGDTLARFQQASSVDAIASDFSDFRGEIQEDAFWFSLQSPFIGTGLGNFEPLFSFSRVMSINQNRAIHPESDWLWLASEMGWTAVAVILAACVWWFRRTLPLENKMGESMRRALIIAFLAFLVHGFVDVSGHGTGTLWVALLIAGMALPAPGEQLPSPATSFIFRALGVALLLLAGVWYYSLHGGRDFPPTTATVARMKATMTSGKLSPPDLVKEATAALKIAPLDWSLYIQRGVAEIKTQDTDAARADFATAQALNPYWIELTIDEGNAWRAASQSDLALDAWTNGLLKLGPAAPEAFRQMVGLAGIHTIEREGLVELAMDRVDYLLLILPGATLDETSTLIEHLLQTDPKLTQLNADQRSQLFTAWWSQGNQVELMQFLHDHPEWEDETWIYEAKFAAKENNYQHACEIAAQRVQEPNIPQSNLAPDETLASVASDFANTPDDLADGETLVLAQMKAGDNDAALATLIQLAKIPDHPRYVAYLQAQLYTQKQDWVAAWEAWLSYLQP
jgi:tetratricopeptide (TPR) repeat protein